MSAVQTKGDYMEKFFTFKWHDVYEGETVLETDGTIIHLLSPQNGARRGHVVRCVAMAMYLNNKAWTPDHVMLRVDERRYPVSMYGRMIKPSFRNSFDYEREWCLAVIDYETNEVAWVSDPCDPKWWHKSHYEMSIREVFTTPYQLWSEEEGDGHYVPAEILGAYSSDDNSISAPGEQWFTDRCLQDAGIKLLEEGAWSDNPTCDIF